MPLWIKLSKSSGKTCTTTATLFLNIKRLSRGNKHQLTLPWDSEEFKQMYKWFGWWLIQKTWRIETNVQMIWLVSLIDWSTRWEVKKIATGRGKTETELKENNGFKSTIVCSCTFKLQAIGYFSWWKLLFPLLKSNSKCRIVLPLGINTVKKQSGN